jgi:hypothetical protein
MSAGFVERMLAFDREATNRGCRTLDKIMSALRPMDFFANLCPRGKEGFQRMVQRSIDAAHKHVFHSCSLEPEAVESRDAEFVCAMHEQLRGAECACREVPPGVFRALRHSLFETSDEDSEDESGESGDEENTSDDEFTCENCRARRGCWTRTAIDEVDEDQETSTPPQSNPPRRTVRPRQVRQLRERQLRQRFRAQMHKAAASLVDTPKFRDVCRRVAIPAVQKILDQALRQAKGSDARVLDKRVHDAFVQEARNPHDVATTFLLRCLIQPV